MSRPVEFTGTEIADAKKVIAETKGCERLMEALAVMITAVAGASVDQVGEILGRSRVTVSRMRKRFRQAACDGAENMPARGSGGRRRELLSIEEEKAFLKPWIEAAKAGGIIVVPPIHRALEERMGRKVATATTYNLLARHGWRKVQPDTRHPKSDENAREDFKKNSQTSLPKRGCWRQKET